MQGAVRCFVHSSYKQNAEKTGGKVSLWLPERLTGGVLYFTGRRVMFSHCNSVSTRTTDTEARHRLGLLWPEGNTD